RRSYSFKPDSLREIVYNEIVEDLKSILGEPVNVIDIDGYRYEYSDYSWILVRKSGTEPKIRLYSEALSSDRLREMVSIIDRRIREIVKKQGGEIIEITIG
ncbi:MAG: phosphoglucomutase, partial [Desulfurococcaceae archaeon]